MSRSEAMKTFDLNDAAKRKPWTDEDYALLEDMKNATHAEVAAALGRSRGSIATLRQKIARGWVRTRDYSWKPSEDHVIIEAGKYATASQIAEKLPGRSIVSVNLRRKKLGVDAGHGNDKKATYIGGRPLIAKSCRSCGLILAADWFTWLPSIRVWSSTCKACRSQAGVEYRKGSEPFKKSRASSNRANKRHHAKMQEITVPNASRSRVEYAESDFAVLANPDLTILQKALLLHRTWKAVKHACQKGGYKSHVGLGDPERDRWLISNPNLGNVDEIREALEDEANHQRAKEIGHKLVEQWDWDD